MVGGGGISFLAGAADISNMSVLFKNLRAEVSWRVKHTKDLFVFFKWIQI